MDQKDRRREETDREDMDLDREMERETEIRRDTQVRGSLGIPPSGSEGSSRERNEGVPEFESGDDEERTSER